MDEEGERRFNLALLVIHPTSSPEAITSGLELEPDLANGVGRPRSTPRGRSLGGTYNDTRWRKGIRHRRVDQNFADELSGFVASLTPKQTFLAELVETGGRVTLIISFLGDGHYSDEIPVSVLSALAGLGITLGIEVYAVPQQERTD